MTERTDEEAADENENKSDIAVVDATIAVEASLNREGDSVAMEQVQHAEHKFETICCVCCCCCFVSLLLMFEIDVEHFPWFSPLVQRKKKGEEIFVLVVELISGFAKHLCCGLFLLE